MGYKKRYIHFDGKHVGDAERVFADAGTGRATHFVISQGFLLTEEKVVPTTWVKKIKANSMIYGARVVRIHGWQFCEIS